MGIGLFSDGFLEDWFFGSRIIRNKRVVEKIQEEQKKKEEKKKGELPLEMIAEGKVDYSKKLGLGFKVFKLQKSNFPRLEYTPNPELSDEENIELLKKYIKKKEAQLVSAFNKDELTTKILIKNGFKFNCTLTKQEEFKKNEILFASDGDKETLICLDVIIADETVEHFKSNRLKINCSRTSLRHHQKMESKTRIG